MNAKKGKTMPLRADRLRHARAKLGLTQHDLAIQSQIGVAQIQRYEHETSDPSGDYLARLAKTLNVSTDWLLGLTEQPGGGYAGEVLTALQEQWLLAYKIGDRDKVIELFTERVRELFRQALEQGLLALPDVNDGE